MNPSIDQALRLHNLPGPVRVAVDDGERPPLEIPGLPVAERRHSRVLQSPLAAPRSGVMLHYDDSSRDDWSLDWFQDPQCTNGYTWLVLRTGAVIELANPALRTPHAGACITPKANSAYYGVAVATNGQVPATEAQLESVILCCRAVFGFHKWKRSSAYWRIVGHDQQAVWTSATTANRTVWGRTGRKVDPTGERPDGRPILSVAAVQRRVAQAP